MEPEELSLRQQLRGAMQAMEAFDFEGVDFVRLRLRRSGCRAYLHAAEDGRSVRDRKSTRLNSSHSGESRMPSSA